MKLTVRDVSAMLEVADKTVYRWLAEGKLPAYRLSGQYRFNRAEILEWATAHKLHVSVAALHEAEDAGQPLPTLAEALQAGGVFYRIGGADRESALRNAVEVLRLPDEVDREFLVQALLAREQLASTGVGDGIAIAHARNPIVLHVDKPVLALCFLETPIDFGALDGAPVTALFTLVSPSARAHLHLLSRLSFALRDAEFKALLREQKGRDELFAAIRRISAGVATADETARRARRAARDTPPASRLPPRATRQGRRDEVSRGGVRTTGRKARSSGVRRP